jgi:hypothetical protein
MELVMEHSVSPNLGSEMNCMNIVSLEVAVSQWRAESFESLTATKLAGKYTKVTAVMTRIVVLSFNIWLDMSSVMFWLLRLMVSDAYNDS